MRVFSQAAALGVLHVFLSGGEPLLRPDLAELCRAARQTGLYGNLITSGVGLSLPRLAPLVAAGLESVQISLQSDEADLADGIAGARAHDQKLAAAKLVRELGLPLTLNVVLHRHNIARLNNLVALAEVLGAERLELANVQFYGWAHRNQAQLLPTQAQVAAAALAAAEAQRRLRGKMEVLYVVPDYYGTRPKACMGGWGRRYLTVNPVGDVLPCASAGEMTGLQFDNVQEHSLAWIWEQSAAFNRFRGTAWMPEPCRGCAQREVDFGGCRCQAALLLGDAAKTDPACALSPDRQVLASLVAHAQEKPDGDGTLVNLKYRVNPTQSV